MKGRCLFTGHSDCCLNVTTIKTKENFVHNNRLRFRILLTRLTKVEKKRKSQLQGKRPSATCIFLYVLSDSRQEKSRHVRMNLFVQTERLFSKGR